MRKALLMFGALMFVAPAAAAGQNVLTWVDNANNEVDQIIERKAVACATVGTFVLLNTVGANVITYTDLAVVEGGTYCYRVAARNSAGTSPYSNTAQRTVPTTLPSAPSGLIIN
jgi:hypothetical protein